MNDDRRPIEEYLPIPAISADLPAAPPVCASKPRADKGAAQAGASREKYLRKGHISTLRLSWESRPLVACWAAVCGAPRHGGEEGEVPAMRLHRRGDNQELWLRADDGTPAPPIDALHRILWRIENEPRSLNRFLDEARPDRERLRLVAQALAGTALERESVGAW